MTYIALYLVAIVLANLSVATFGPSVAVVNAFLLIGLDLTARDKLHDAWHGCGLWWKMALLIASGSILSYVLERSSGQIALASFVAFACANIADTFTYHLLGNKTQYIRVNGSNVISSGVDSFLFPTLAFGWPPLWGIVFGQFVAKIVGGFIWLWVFNFVSSKLSRQGEQ